MGLDNESKAVSTPGVRTTDEEDGKELGAEDRACYRSWTMRASFLSQDRCELQFAVKELAMRMQQLNTKNMQALKRLVRFLKESPRCLVVYSRQPEQPVVDVFSDSDWAGYTKTRRWTSSSFVMLGSLSRQQQLKNVVATSSGEAEFYALTKSASSAFGAVVLSADMAKVVKPRVRVDATASKVIASRRGVGKVPGSENPADMGTKHQAQREMHECMRRAGCRIVGGRSTSPGRLESAALRLR